MAEEFVTMEAHKEFAARIEAEDKRQNERIKKLEESYDTMQKLTISVEKMAVSVQSMAKEVGKQGERLSAIEEKPAKNWEKAVWAIGGAVLAAVVAYILKVIGL